MRLLPAPPSVLLALLALTACQHPQPAPRAPRAPMQAAADPGVAVLAAVQNARAAIAAGDRLAAFNNVTVAISNASQLTGSDSALFPPQAAPPDYAPPAAVHGGGQSGVGGDSGHRRGRHRSAVGGAGPPGPAAGSTPAPTYAAASAGPPSAGSPRKPRVAGGDAEDAAEISSFGAQVRLTSINAQLQSGDVAGADAGLQALEASAAGHPAPADLPLVRADQSLILARAAANAGRLGELKTLLQTARAALQAYDGRPHAAEAKALARAIDDALNHAGGVGVLAPAELSLWSGRLSSWV